MARADRVKGPTNMVVIMMDIEKCMVLIAD